MPQRDDPTTTSADCSSAKYKELPKIITLSTERLKAALVTAYMAGLNDGFHDEPMEADTTALCIVTEIDDEQRGKPMSKSLLRDYYSHFIKCFRFRGKFYDFRRGGKC